MAESELPEDAVTVAIPANRGAIVVEGSERRECSECGTDVWVSPATRVSIDRGVYPDTIVCVPCAGEGVDDAE